jgi:hypothetical protein
VAQVTIDGDHVVVNIVGWDRVFALKSELRIPVSHIRGVSTNPEEAHQWWHGLRLGGTEMPGVITAGTFYTREGKFFYDVHDPDRTVALDLDHEFYKKVIIQVDDPEIVARAIQDSLPG